MTSSPREQPGRISSERVYSGKVISLDVDTVRFPDGSTGELEMIRHPGASAILAFLDDETVGDPRVVLIKQYRYAANTFLLEIPAGRMEEGETPLACARRELEEETGWIAGDCQQLASMYTTPGFTDERIHLFIAHGLTPGSPAHEADEFLRVVTFRLSDALQMVVSGQIEDAKTVVALFMAEKSRGPR